MRKLTVKELESLINLSHTAIREKIRAGEFDTSLEKINRRETTVLIINENKMQELIRDYGARENASNFNQVEENLNQVYTQVEATHEQPVKVIASSENLVEQVINLSRNFSETLINQNQEIKQLYQEMLNSNSQLKLLEDSESRTKREFNELAARVKQLEEENKQLKEELSKTLEYKLGLKKLK